MTSREQNYTKAKLFPAMAESDERLARYLRKFDGGGTVDRLQEKVEPISFS